MATITTNQNLADVSYPLGDIITVNDGVTLTINSQWAPNARPTLIQALGTGRIEIRNSSTTTPLNLEFYMQNNSNIGGFIVEQNAVLQVRGGWITVGTSTGANNQVLFNSKNINGVEIDYPTLIEVETGSGTNVWEIWQAIPEDVTGGTNNTLGFNTANITAGTVSVGASGVVTGVGTAFVLAHQGLPFKLPGITRDFVIGQFTSATSIIIQELDGSTYTGGVVAAGTTYILRSGSLINPSQVGSGDLGKVLFINPLTRVVRMGDGTNGTKIPTGARVRIPNIHFNSAEQKTTLASAITGTAAQTFNLTAAIGPTTNAGANVNQAIGSFLLVNGTTFERINFLNRGAASPFQVAIAGQARGANGTVAQSSFAATSTEVYWIPGPVNTNNNAGFDCDASGIIDLQVCSVGMRWRNLFINYGSLTLKDFGCLVLQAGNSPGPYDLDTISVLGGSYQVQSAIFSPFQLSSMLGSGRVENVHLHNNFHANPSATNYTFSNIQNAQSIKNIRSRIWGRSAQSANNLRGFLMTTIKCATPIDGLYSAGGSISPSAMTNLDVKNIFLSSLPNANSIGASNSATVDSMNPLVVASTVDSTFRGLQVWNGGLSPRATLLSIDSSSEAVVCHNKGYPDFAASSQMATIALDNGLNSVISWISLTNARVVIGAQSYLQGNIVGNSGGLLRMLLTDSITSTGFGTGGGSKSGVEIDVVAGPHRLYNNATITTAFVPNLVDVQPIVVLSNVAKTVGSVYVGGFSAQSAFDMYQFTGGALLDNLGRIYYPGVGDSVIIKSVFALKGVSGFAGTAFDFNYNQGAGVNPIPAGTTLEFRMVNFGEPNTGAWTTFVDNSNLETARAALVGYNTSVGLDLQIRITGTTAVAARHVMGLKFPATIDEAYAPSVYETELGFSGVQTGTLIAGYDNTVPATPVLKASGDSTLQMPYDYDGVPVAYRLVARKAGWTFSNLTGTYTKIATVIPITQNEVVDVNGDPLYVDAITGVTVNHGAGTITVSASRSAAQVWSAVQDNLSLLANLTRPDPFSTSNGASFASAYNLAVSGVLTSGNITGSVTLTGSLSSGVAITGNVAQATPTNLTGVTINGNLTFNTNSPITVVLTDCGISGTVSNSGSATVTINRSNSTIGTVGARVATRPVTALNLTGLTAGSQIYVVDGTGAEVAYVAASGTSYSLTTTGETGTWVWKVARYGFTAQSGTHSPATASTTLAVTLAADLSITQATKATVGAYISLDNLDKLYDYAAFYETTNEGIAYDRIITKAGTSASAGSYPVTINDLGDLFLFDGTSLSIYTNYTLSAGVTITGALFTSGVVTLPTVLNDAAIIANVSQPDPGDLTAVSITGNLTYNTVSIVPITLVDCAVSGTVSNIGGGAVTITKVNTTLGTLGLGVNALQFATISAPNLLEGSRVRLFNDTDGIELYNEVLIEAGLSYEYVWEGDKTITMTATYVSGVTAMLGLLATGVIGSNGLVFLSEQAPDPVYNAYGISGSTVVGFTADYANNELNLAMASNFLGTRLYAWWVYNTTTEQGIRQFFGGLTGIDESNIRINAAVVNLFLDNVTDDFIFQNDTVRLFRSDSAYPARTMTSGGGGIDVNWNSNVYVGTSGVEPADIAVAVRASVRPDLNIINDGVQNASLIIPHSTDLPTL